MRNRIILLVVGVVAAISLALTGPAVAGTEAKTTVTIKGPNGDFHGKIKSDDDGCLGDRAVKLYMSETADGTFTATGNSDTSEQQGNVGVWSMGNTGLRDGFFYAKAKKTPDCKGGKSKVIHLIDGVPQ
jgi:hypothetical protein